MNISELTSRLRRVPNLSHFAARSGVSRRTLHRLLVGWNNPTLRTLESIERQLKREGA